MNKTVLFGTVAAVAVAAGLYLTASSTENVNVAGVSFNSAIAEIETAAGSDNGTFIVDQLTATTGDSIETLETQAGGLMDQAKEAMGFDTAADVALDPALDPAMMDAVTGAVSDTDSMVDGAVDKAVDMGADATSAVVGTAGDMVPDSVKTMAVDKTKVMAKDGVNTMIDGAKGQATDAATDMVKENAEEMVKDAAADKMDSLKEEGLKSLMGQ